MGSPRKPIKSVIVERARAKDRTLREREEERRQAIEDDRRVDWMTGRVCPLFDENSWQH